MKYLLLLILTFNFVSAFAISEYALAWLAIDPSSINRAIGGDAVGVVNIWHSNPLTSYFNPAIPAFHEGFSYGYTRINWLQGSGINDITYNAGLISIGYKGIALTLPAPNAQSKFGIDMDYGQQEITDENGQDLGSFHSYEDAHFYGIAINPIELIRNLGTVNPILNHFDFALGLNEVSIKSVLAPEGQGQSEQNVQGSATASCMDFGAIAKFSYNVSQYANLEAVYGSSIFNTGDSKISYINQEQADPIFSQNNKGFALSASLLPERIFQGQIDPKYIFCENLLSIRYLSSSITDDNDADIKGHGTEIGILDTFFFRSGRYEDKPGFVVGNTSGYGINLHYKKMISLSYNYAKVPMGELVDTQKSSDYCLSFDFISLYNAFK
jgi:hypothetical protein